MHMVGHQMPFLYAAALLKRKACKKITQLKSKLSV